MSKPRVFVLPLTMIIKAAGFIYTPKKKTTSLAQNNNYANSNNLIP